MHRIKGYAEKDPTADIEGHDPCRKIAILTSLIAGQQVDFEDIHCEGITKITADDFKYAKAMNRSIKLLASSRKAGSSYTCMVAPYMIDSAHPLCGVNGYLTEYSFMEMPLAMLCFMEAEPENFLQPVQL